MKQQQVHLRWKPSIFTVTFVLTVLPWAIVFLNAELRFMPCRPSSQELVALLSSPDPNRVMAALSHLTQASDPGGLEVASTLLESKNQYISLNAAEYMGTLGDRRAVPRLIEALRGPVFRQHDKYRTMLQRLTGQEIDGGYDAWIGWWRESRAGAVGDVRRQ